MIASSVSSNGATETNVQVDAKTLKECLISAGKGGSSPRVKKDATYDFAGHLVVNQVLRHLAIALLRDDAFGPKRGGDTTFTGLVEVQAAVFQGNLIVASNKHNEKLCENLK